MSQWHIILELFRIKGGVLTTADFADNRQLSCEYRRALCDLRRHGYAYRCTPISRNLFKYELTVEPSTETGDVPIPKQDLPPSESKVCAPILRRETEITHRFDSDGQGLLLEMGQRD